MGSGFGAGSSQTMFGSSGAGNFLTKLTTAIATLFMITSLTLAIMSSNEKSRSIMFEDKPAVKNSAKPDTEAGDEKSN